MSIAGFLLPISDLTDHYKASEPGTAGTGTKGPNALERGRAGSWGKPLLQGGLTKQPIYMEPQEVSRHLKQVTVPEENCQLTSALVLV